MAELAVVVLICTMAGLLVGFVIGRESGRKSLLTLLDDLRNTPFEPPQQPQFQQYVGTQGLFLGRFASTIRDGWEYDLYYNDENPETVIARYGNGHADFIMALCTESEDDNSEPLAEALRRVRDSGL